jgi:hypothetical protein
MRPARSYYAIDGRDHPKARSGCSDRETPDRFSFESFRSLGFSRFRFLGLSQPKGHAGSSELLTEAQRSQSHRCQKCKPLRARKENRITTVKMSAPRHSLWGPLIIIQLLPKLDSFFSFSRPLSAVAFLCRGTSS